MFANATRILTPSVHTVAMAAIFSLLILVGCASPAQDLSSPAGVSEQETMEAEATESDSMADTDGDLEHNTDDPEEMATEEMATEQNVSTAEESEPVDDSTMAESAKTDSETVDNETTNEIDAGETMAAVDLPAWQQMTLTDARTGEPFTFADFSGKTVFVEPMATWCSNCRRQLTNVQEAGAQFGDDVVFVALSVETNIAREELATYADNAGFGYTFAVMTPEMLGELAGAFGQTISNPPATPHFIIRPDGSTTDLVTGIEPAADIVAQLEAARG